LLVRVFVNTATHPHLLDAAIEAVKTAAVAARVQVGRAHIGSKAGGVADMSLQGPFAMVGRAIGTIEEASVGAFSFYVAVNRQEYRPRR
jgi:hypothetical protein